MVKRRRMMIEPEETEAKVEEKPTEVKAEVEYVVKPGMSITSAGGILGPGMVVKPEMFSDDYGADGEKVFAALKEAGTIVPK